MPKQVVTVDADSTELLARYAAVREEFKVPQAFPAEVLAEVERAIATVRTIACVMRSPA
jgi:hypothetical protein